MKRGKLQFLLCLICICFCVGCFYGFTLAATEKAPKVGPVKINPHPNTLDGKTVVLRWNGKMNGDKYLARVGELLAEKFKNVKIIKLWEIDKTTAAISKNLEASQKVASAIAQLKADLVIAAQAD